MVSGLLLSVSMVLALALPGAALAQAGAGSSNSPVGIGEKSIPGTTPPPLGATPPAVTTSLPLLQRRWLRLVLLRPRPRLHIARASIGRLQPSRPRG